MKKYIYLLLSIVVLTSCGGKDLDFGDTSVEPASQQEPTLSYTEAYSVLQSRSVKRGVAFSFNLESDYALLAPGTSWCYNWGFNGQGNDFCEQYNIEYCPMGWSGIPGNAAAILKNHPEWKYLLGFNEPNLTDQANMTPAVAAQKWPEVVNAAKSANKKLVSPAMNWGTLAGWSNGVAWLESFFNQPNVDLNDIDGIAMHVYMGSSAALLGDIKRYKKFGKPLWLTEFCNWDAGSESSQIQFMTETLNALEQDDDVARYAWFTPRSGKFTVKGMALLTSKQPFALTNSGLVFVHMSTFDKTIKYPVGLRIPAAHYRACSVAGNGGAVHVNVTSDRDGIVQLNQLQVQNWVDYKIDFNGQKNISMMIRYAAGSGAQFELNYVNEDGEETPVIDPFQVEKTGNPKAWATAKINIGKVPNGAKVIRLRVLKGMPNINWIKFTTL